MEESDNKTDLIKIGSYYVALFLQIARFADYIVTSRLNRYDIIGFVDTSAYCHTVTDRYWIGGAYSF